MDYESFEFALIAGPFFTAVNATAGVLLSFIGDVRPVRVSLPYLRKESRCRLFFRCRILRVRVEFHRSLFLPHPLQQLYSLGQLCIFDISARQ